MVDLKELKRLVKYLRKEGITEFKNGDLEFKLGNDPIKQGKRVKKIPQSQNDVSDIVNDVPNDGPTTEELLFWSAGGAANPLKEDN